MRAVGRGNQGDVVRRRSWPRGRTGLFLAAAAVVWLICGVYYCTVNPSPDEFIFDYLGLLATKGVTFYRGAFDISWPGPLLYHEAGVLLFGVHSWTARLQDFCLLPIGLAGLWLTAQRTGFVKASWALLLVYPLVYVTSGGWMAGHRDIVAMHMLLLAAGMLLGETPRRHLVRIGVGVIVGYVTFVRPTYLFVALPFWLIEMAREPGVSRRLLATAQFALGLLLVVAAFAAAGFAEGSIADWYEQAVLFPIVAYQVPEGRLRLVGLLVAMVREHFLWPAIVGVSGYPLWAWRPISPGRDQWANLYVLALVTTVLVSYFVQNKGFGYHLGGLIPLCLLSAAMGAEAGIQALASRGLARGMRWLIYPALGATISLSGIGIASRVGRNILPVAARVERGDLAEFGSSGAPERAEAARIVAHESGSEDLVLQWGWDYDIPYLAERKSATRYVNVNLLAQIRPQNQRLRPWLDRFKAEMVRDRVALIVIDTNVLPRTAFLPVVHPEEAMPASTKILLTLIAQGYRPIYDRGQIVILKRT